MVLHGLWVATSFYTFTAIFHFCMFAVFGTNLAFSALRLLVSAPSSDSVPDVV